MYIKILFTMVAILAVNLSATAQEMKLAVTTSFNNSGLSDILIPEIKKDINLEVQLLVVGTGQALKLGRSGDVDAILVHSKAAEEAFVSEGFGTHRREIMYNDFVLIGPSNDPAGISKSINIADALTKIREVKSTFVSRGDDSGTHRKEISLWETMGRNPEAFSADWYREVGSGMGATLNTASGLNAYLLSDRASWLKFANKGNLKMLFEGDPILFNQYAYLPVSPTKHPHVKFIQAKQLEAWLTSPKAQKIIGTYKIGEETLFTPNAKPKD